MKKLISMVLFIAILFTASACGSVSTASEQASDCDTVIEQLQDDINNSAEHKQNTTVLLSEKYARNSVEPVSLGGYTIVYPSEYIALRMDIVHELNAAIKEVTGTEVNVASDATDVDGKKIILASGVTEHAFKDEIEVFDDRMDYVVAVDGDDIVLGGKNYYADIRAVYDFMENFLGYTSLDGKITKVCEPQSLNGVHITYYEEPEFIIDGATWGPSMTKEEHFKDLADANFNHFMTHYYGYDDLASHNLAKWAAKYEVQLLLNTNTSPEVKTAEIYWDCPMIYGFYLWDEPQVLKGDMEKLLPIIEEFEKNYSKYGWKAFVNFGGSDMTTYLSDALQTKELDATAFDSYIFVAQEQDKHGGREGKDYMFVLQQFMDMAKAYDQTAWVYIQSYTRAGGTFNASKGYRWQMYMDLCFDVDGVLYFGYTWQNEEGCLDWSVPASCVVTREFEKGDNYYYAKTANEDILKAVDILSDYNYVGAYTINSRREQTTGDYVYARFNECEDQTIIDEIIAPDNGNGKPTSYLVGTYENGFMSSERAMILMNLEMINDVEFGKDAESIAKVKLNGSNPKFYFEGELVDVRQDQDGYYLIDIANGDCWIVTVE